MKVRIKKLRPEAAVPAAATPMSAGYDLRACIGAAVTLYPGEPAMIPTGLAMAPESSGAVGLIFSRSGLGAKHGVVVRNGVGVIDADYRGEIMVTLVNTGHKPFSVRPGDRIAQLVFVPVLAAEFELSPDLDETERGRGGFGSTGLG